MTKSASPNSAPKTAILAVSGNQSELSMLSCLFVGSSWALCTAETLEEAGERLHQHPFPVVFCYEQLSDGEWKDLLKMADRLEDRPSVIVMSRQADETLFAEALNSGAFDVLPGPANQKDIFSTLSSGWRSWKERKQRHRTVRASA